MKTKTLLETDEWFTYEKTEVCDGIEFEIYVDSTSMSYFLAWMEDGEVREWCCGMCNDYKTEMQDIAAYLKNKG